MHHRKLIWMIFSLVTDANRDAIRFPSWAEVNNKGYSGLTSQTERPSTLSTVVVYTDHHY